MNNKLPMFIREGSDMIIVFNIILKLLTFLTMRNILVILSKIKKCDNYVKSLKKLK